ncbi:hypothetical protein TGPRC2_255880 [Toxoplasma gondii TgCatPRC2]|uniref:Uncharacterized protein n=12 Tax=Toxoplasma gondii TaxID=5811 RepID=S7UZM5_TOXGG|nr:hypothetical protein TGGT1_255880 [Toxoplasma gondii GT1]KAF4641516.1 hypothetical protein TGRH88_073260 [Toxoplasma gondii]KFG31198.1 hypothetical protein TGDOM2_255880 [Toxoplasma gondii GAB2-2007-GAL-DOM2]KFG50506.1 hypothetical protein TGP89_255880 [Toxoplasma gondii p89]KFG57608.1 hypothetical protein TGRUB_255880 [Toxoplasma gondii RUB]KFH02844.1 hypothetical protein TGVAND_255880 [Toxoplasma gondii VAND]KYK63434.1 hypothetical protein TGPRC2_255880 [Toxoplasma gondii TgCatPRC2]PUA8
MMITTNRSCEIHFVNNTSVVWYRHLHSVHHGCWLQPPLESIFPNQTMVCLAECTRSFGSFSGKIQYAVVLNDVEYIVSSEFEVPILGDNRHVSVMGCNADPRIKKMPDPMKLFELSYTADTFVYSKFLVTVKETAEGSVFLQKCREELEQALKEFYQVSPQGLADPLDLPSRIPMHFVWNVKNVDWKKRLRKSHRSMLIRIVNLTTHLLVLDHRREEKERLEEGVWLEFPSEQIPPLCLTEFGCHSDGFLFGTGGSCTYLIPGRPGQFVFFWDQPGMGGCRSLGVHTGKAFRVFKHTENLNEGTIVFHVIDPSHPPCVQIVQARSLHPQRLASFQSSSFRTSESRSGSSAQLLPSSASARREFLRDSTDLTTSLVAYLRRSALESSGIISGNFPSTVSSHFGRSPSSSVSTSAPSVVGSDEPLGSRVGAGPSGSSVSGAAAGSGTHALGTSPQPLAGGRLGRDSGLDGDEGTKWGGSVEISLVSPRAFFCALQSTKTLRGASQPNSLLYIQWRIGSELFERVFGPDERVFLHGGLVGGLERNQTDLILRAEPVNLRRLPPGLKVADLYAGDSGGLSSLLARSVGAGGAPGAVGPGAPGVPPVTNEAELLEVLVRGFRICASGLLREVSERMEAAFGVDWLAKCDLPRQHIWRDLGSGEGEQIDLEGLLHIMTAFWDEVFEERLQDPQPLHAMQAVVIYWATQELAVLDGPNVFSFFETAIKVLRKLGQPVHANKLQDLSRALDGTTNSFSPPCVASVTNSSVEHPTSVPVSSLKEGTTGSTFTGAAA